MRKRVGILEILLLIIPILVIFALITKFFMPQETYAKYEVIANSNEEDDNNKIQFAKYLLKAGYEVEGLNLGEIEPRSTPYTYNFYISNYDGSKRTEVNLEYDLSIICTTNLPLSYKLYYDNDTTSDIITDRVIERDGDSEDDAYFITLKTDTKNFTFNSNQRHYYTLEVTFPEIYKDSMYQDITEFVIVNIDSRQVVDES